MIKTVKEIIARNFLNYYYSEIHLYSLVYDSRGKIVKNILRDFQISGKYSVNWGGKNNNGIAVSFEIDFYEIQTKYSHQKRKMLLLK